MLRRAARLALEDSERTDLSTSPPPLLRPTQNTQQQQAWVFAALSDEGGARAPLYWAFAALYAAPALTHGGGLSLDGAAVAAAAACALHVQVEKAARTSTARVRLPPGGLVGAARVVGGAAVDAASTAAGAAGAVGRAAREGLGDGSGGSGSASDENDPYAFDPADAAAGRAALPADVRRRVDDLEAELARSAALDAELLAAFDDRLKEKEERGEGGGSSGGGG